MIPAFQKQLSVLVCFFCLLIGNALSATNLNENQAKSPIHISLVKANFATMTNDLHPGNRIGYRFHEHEPIAYGKVPLSNLDANIDAEELTLLEKEFKNSEKVFIYKHEIGKDKFWVKQDWIYYLKPVEDGIEIIWVIETYGEGLPAYYGVQQCFRLSGETNAEWRKKIAHTPAFSEYDLWRNQEAGSEKSTLTYVLRGNIWQAIPVDEKTLGARTPSGLAVDFLRTDGNPMSEVGPYKATMLTPVDNPLITRTDLNGSWVSAIYWQNTSHVTNHHPADCLHSIVNIGNIPPFSKRIVHGKIYWFEGNKEELYQHYSRDFLGERINKKIVVASCQFPVGGEISSNANWIKNQMRLAKIQGADLVHFPECALSGYGGADIPDFGDYDWDLLKVQTDSVLTLAKELKVWVVLGSSHQLSAANKPHNSLYLISPEGKILDRYDKRFCTTGDLNYYTPGDHFVTFEINGIKCGLLICYDIRFPELYREYCKLGVEVMFHSFYNARHRENCIHPKIMPPTAQARAASNAVFISLTNSSAAYSWPCYFITPDGLIVNKLPANEPGMLISEIDLTKKYYDPSMPYRLDAIHGKLNSGETVQDPRSKERSKY